jgi:hypothetical protein
VSVLSPTARHEYYFQLANSLPPPVLKEPGYRERRIATAIETFDALRSGDAYEAQLAVRIVLCGAHADESLRLAGHYRDDFAKMTRCRAQAAGMMRAEASAKRTLEREQRMRLAVEAVAGGGPLQVEPPASPPVLVAAAAPPSAPEVPAVAPPRLAAADPEPLPAQAASAPPPSPEAIAKAEAFAEREIVAAVQIRHDRGVTPRSKEYFRHVALPSDPAVIDALVRGSSEVLTLLDEVGGEMLEAAD